MAETKSGFYRWVKIGGSLSLIPFILAAGPLGGYFLGDYLDKVLGLRHASWICMFIGIAGSAYETVRVIRFALKAEEGK